MNKMNKEWIKLFKKFLNWIRNKQGMNKMNREWKTNENIDNECIKWITNE